MKKYKIFTRKQFEDRETNLKKMRRKDPYQFDILYREYCRLKGYQPTSNR